MNFSSRPTSNPMKRKPFTSTSDFQGGAGTLPVPMPPSAVTAGILSPGGKAKTSAGHCGFQPASICMANASPTVRQRTAERRFEQAQATIMNNPIPANPVIAPLLSQPPHHRKPLLTKNHHPPISPITRLLHYFPDKLSESTCAAMWWRGLRLCTMRGGRLIHYYPDKLSESTCETAAYSGQRIREF